jgi:aspartyl-tRNA(Asn)/glutamyl-tRNA(Gln) amidotransferase subunit A
VSNVKPGYGAPVLEHIWITELPVPPGRPRLAVKDLFDTAGIRTTYGSAIFGDHVPSASAKAVDLLEHAGYVNVGKANLHEFAWGITSENEHYGWVPNPLAEGRMAGGSSGGSAAALAAGLADAGLGSDSGGSIRIPAACCGVVGFKPTHGVVPIEGCFPLAPSYDTAGPMARDVAGCEAMMRALVPGFAPVEVELADLAVGVAWTDVAEPLVRARVEDAARLFPGARSHELSLPPAEAYPVFQREAAEVHEPLWRDHRDAYGANVAAKVERALQMTDAEFERAQLERANYRDQIAAALDGLDLVVTPTLETVAPPSGIGDLALRDSVIRLTLPWNTVGYPALALPCGTAELGLPASVQLIGQPGTDALVLAAGRALEAQLATHG